MSDFEISELQQTTIDLLENGPVYEIALRRSTQERTAAGGVRPVNPQDLAPQTFYFIPVVAQPRVVYLSEGEKVEANHVLIGHWDSDLKAKDTFVIDGRKFLVAEIHMDRRFQVKAWVVEKQ